VAATALNIATIVLFWAAVGLLVGQLVSTRRGGWSVVGGLMIGSYVLDNMLSNVDALKTLTWLLPFHYYNLSKPLVPGRGLDGGTWLVLVGLTLVALALAAWLFAHRDLGAAFRLWPARAQANTSPAGGSLALLGSVFTKNIRDLLLPTLGWSLALGGYAMFIVSITDVALKPIRDIMNNMPGIAQIFGNMASNDAWLAAGLFLQLPLLLAVFGLNHVGNWATDEEEGRLELLVAHPVPRLQILLARYLAAVLSVVAILVALGAAIFLGAQLSNLALDGERIIGALVAVTPLPLAVLAFGLVLATWLARPGPAVAVTGAVIVAMFFLDLLVPLLGWPDELRRLSIFYLYGRPLMEGVTWGNVALLSVAALALAAASLVGFRRRDIAK
jgi:ABC-2 type transport system permease protein